MYIQDISRYKYLLRQTDAFYVGIFPPYGKDLKHEEITLTTKGHLILEKGFMWDGASGAVDSENFLVPSAIHDAGYRLIRLRLLPVSAKKSWDDLLDEMTKERGMTGLRRTGVSLALGTLGHLAVRPDPKNDYIQILEVY